MLKILIFIGFLITSLYSSNVEVIKIINKEKNNCNDSIVEKPVEKIKIVKNKYKKVKLNKKLKIKLFNPNTLEVLVVKFYENKGLSKNDCKKLNNFFRDFRENKTVKIDKKLFIYLAKIFSHFENAKYIILHSGYRTERTQDILKKLGYKPAKRSLHLKGKAIDFNIAGVSSKKIYEFAKKLKYGGLGYYPVLGHIHIDTGRFRVW